jgi:hypothetical protein
MNLHFSVLQNLRGAKSAFVVTLYFTCNSIYCQDVLVSPSNKTLSIKNDVNTTLATDTAIAVNNVLVGSSAPNSRQIGVYNDVRKTGNSFQFGTYNSILGVTTLDQNGTFNQLSALSNGNKYGTQNVLNNGQGNHWGVYNTLTGVDAGERFGVSNGLSGSGGGSQIGVQNFINNSGGGTHYGLQNNVLGTGAGNHHGIENVLSGSGTGIQYGLKQTISNSANNTHYAVYNEMSGGGTGSHYGIFQNLSGSGTGSQFGLRQNIGVNGNGLHYGMYNILNGTGSGEHCGGYNEISGTGSGTQYGTKNIITNTGNGTHYALRNDISGTGNGPQYGIYSLITNTGSGDRTGIFTRMIGNSDGHTYGTYLDMQNLLADTIYGNFAFIEAQADNLALGHQCHINQFGNGIVMGSRNQVYNYSSLGQSIGVSNELTADGTDATQIVAKNTFEGNSTGFHYGTQNNVDARGTNYGTYNYIQTSDTGIGMQHGTSNNISNEGTGKSFGTYNILSGAGSGDQYGSFQSILSTGSGVQYGTYNKVDNTGSGDHIAGYFQASGGAKNYAAIFNKGDVVMNESGENNDLRVESMDYTNMFLIDADLNRVGIRTSSPSDLFHINCPNTEDAFRIEVGGSTKLKVYANGSISFNGPNTGISSNDAYFDNQVGFGVPNPTYRIELENNSNNSRGKGLAFAWDTYSDKRVKSNIESITYGLEEILKLHPVSYDHHTSDFANGTLNIKKDASHTIGFIAQEVHKILPEVVSVPADENSDLWSMDYERIIPVLVKAIQQQQQIINNQTQVLEKQHQLFSDIQVRLELLEKANKLANIVKN